MPTQSNVRKFFKGLLRNFVILLTLFLAIKFFREGPLWAAFILAAIFMALMILRHREHKSNRKNEES